jgi:hypothetical protein
MIGSIFSDIISWVITGLLGALLAIILRKYRKLKKENIEKNMFNETVGLVRIYDSRQEAIKDQKGNLINSDKIRYLSFNGQALLDTPVFLDSTLYKICKDWSKNSKKEIDVLFLNPKRKDIITKRIERLNIAGITADEEKLKNDKKLIIRNARTYLELDKITNNVGVKLGFYDSDLLWCLLIYEKFVLLSFYQDRMTANWARTLLLDKTSLLSKSLINFFDFHWNISKMKNKNDLDKLEEKLK